MVLNSQNAYLIGLVCGRGHFYVGSKRIAVEFSHANKYVAKILHCDVCGNLATGFGLMKCKGCGKTFSKDKVKKVEQVEATKKSVLGVVAPFLAQTIDSKFDVVSNTAMTLLVLDFQENPEQFDELYAHFKPNQSFDSFHIPDAVKNCELSLKQEFVNGLMDAAGFNNAGSWMPRNGRHAHGRMRGYFQVVRNWHMPVEIDNYLRREFKLPIQTIDWGHPNIRDSGLKDYYESGTVSWSREHQIKFFPEYYKQFSFRLSHKQELFEDLIKHNEYAGFDRNEDWFPPSKVRDTDIKAHHPGESDLRIPEPARRHFDKFWQVNAAMGCEYIGELVANTKYPECFLETGVDEYCDIEALTSSREVKRNELTEVITKKYETKKSLKRTPSIRGVRTNPEQELYAPLTSWFKKHLSETYNQDALAYDVSSGNLNQFISRDKDLVSVFDYCSNYRIKPDIVGFLHKSKEMAFIEAKVTALSLKEVGQLMGYCLVAKPAEAWLVSSKSPSASLIRILQAHPVLLEYAPGKRIKIATWVNGQMQETGV